jgi:hypothetical protein
MVVSCRDSVRVNFSQPVNLLLTYLNDRPLRIRAPTNALSTSANWIFNFLVVMIAPVAFDSIGYQTYIVFAVMYDP